MLLVKKEKKMVLEKWIKRKAIVVEKDRKEERKIEVRKRKVAIVEKNEKER